MSFMLRLLMVLVLVLANLPAFAQQAVKPVGSNQAQLLPNPFASADNIAAQTATFMHGGLMAWDSGGSNWDRLLTTSGALHVNVQNASLSVTGTFWQATQPVSGTVTVQQSTGSNLHMVCDSGCGSAAGQSASGSLTAVSQTVTLAYSPTNVGNAFVQVTGTWSGIIEVQVTLDGTNWVSVLNIWNVNTSAIAFPTGLIDTNGIYAVPTGAAHSVRVFSSGWTSGTATVNIRAAVTTPYVSGNVAISGNPQIVSGSSTNTNNITGASQTNNVFTDPTYGGAAVQIYGTWVGTIQFESSNNGSDWVAQLAYPLDGGPPVSSTTSNGVWIVPTSGVNQTRLRSSSWTSGTASTWFEATMYGGRVAPTTQPVSGTVTANVGTFPDNEPFNVAQYGGSAVGAGNAVHVQPGTGANFTTTPGGNVAHGAADSGNPIKVGCQARTTNRTAEADADRVDCVADKNGQIVVTPMAPRDRVVRSGVITLTTTTETTLIAAGGAGVFRDLTYLKCTNSSATLTRVDLRDATAGTVIDSWALAANGGGFNLAFSVPYAQATANNNWTVQLSGAVTDVRCSAQAVEKN